MTGHTDQLRGSHEAVADDDYPGAQLSHGLNVLQPALRRAGDSAHRLLHIAPGRLSTISPLVLQAHASALGSYSEHTAWETPPPIVASHLAIVASQHLIYYTVFQGSASALSSIEGTAWNTIAGIGCLPAAGEQGGGMTWSQQLVHAPGCGGSA